MTPEEILKVCVVCMGPAPAGSKPLPVTHEGREYHCNVCPDCVPNITRRDRATFNNHLPRAVSNLARMLAG